MTLLAHGGMLPRYEPNDGERKVSPRRKGVKQGVLLFLIGALLVPLLGVFAAFSPDRISVAFQFFAAVAAIICFGGGALRMFYAALFEESARTHQFVAPTSYAPPAISHSPARLSALPPSKGNPTVGWKARPETAEILQPPSVTDNTTRLLEKHNPDTE